MSTPRSIIRRNRVNPGMKFDPGWPDYKADKPGFWRRIKPQREATQVSRSGEHIRYSNGQVRNPDHQKRRDLRKSRSEERKFNLKYFGSISIPFSILA